MPVVRHAGLPVAPAAWGSPFDLLMVARPPVRLHRANTVKDPFPVHPASERAAAWFHGIAAVVCAAHVVIGLIGSWYHWTGAIRHYRDRE